MEDADRCCGFGGVFSVKFPEVSAAMARRKTEGLLATGASTLVVGDPGCLLNLRGYLSRRGLPIQVRHLAEILGGKS